MELSKDQRDYIEIATFTILIESIKTIIFLFLYSNTTGDLSIEKLVKEIEPRVAEKHKFVRRGLYILEASISIL